MAILDGNVIQNNMGGGRFGAGGGLGVRESVATLNDNVILDNIAVAGGGAWLNNSNVTLNGNTIRENAASGWGVSRGGGLDVDGGKVTLSNNTIRNNLAEGTFGGVGGGLSLFNTVATLSGNTIRDNAAKGDEAFQPGEGGGIRLVSNTITLQGNIIQGNVSSHFAGGLYLSAGDATLVNNLIADNQADLAGSGAYVGTRHGRFLHTTFARNAGGEGTGLYVVDGDGGESFHRNAIVLTNTIFVSHSVAISVTGGITAMVNGVLWFDNGENNTGAGTLFVTNGITGDPAFAADGYHLLAGSPAIDRGVDAGVTSDIDGQARPYGAAPDLGADEYNLTVPLSSVTISGPTTGTVNIGYTFTAYISPTTGTGLLPVSYVWQASEWNPVTHTGGISATVVFTWTRRGAKVIIVTASNGSGKLVASDYSISIEGYFCLLPVVLRHY
jgi:hypothetical protein